jgi:hypothetical protein
MKVYLDEGDSLTMVSFPRSAGSKRVMKDTKAIAVGFARASNLKPAKKWHCTGTKEDGTIGMCCLCQGPEKDVMLCAEFRPDESPGDDGGYDVEVMGDRKARGFVKNGLGRIGKVIQS